MRRDKIALLDAYSRHKKFVNDYVKFYGRDTSTAPRKKIKDDFALIKKHHQFLRDPDEDEKDLDWERRLAKRYHDKLFKQFCLVDLRYHLKYRLGMRWRTEQEVMDGKGQFECGSLHCTEKEALSSMEVNFEYKEDGVTKNALVQVRLCPDCVVKLKISKSRDLESHRKRSEPPSDDTERKETGDLENAKRKASDDKPYDAETSLKRGRPDESKVETRPILDEGAIWAAQPSQSRADKSTLDEFDEFFAGLF